MLHKYQYRRRLPHLQRNTSLFVTFSTFHGRRLSPSERDIVLECCRYANGRTVTLHAVVVMPDHVHLLFTPLDSPDREPYSIPEILQPIKGASSHRITRWTGSAGPVWQAESFDRIPRSAEKRATIVEYIRFNPVWAKLVEHPDQYRWTWIADEISVVPHS